MGFCQNPNKINYFPKNDETKIQNKLTCKSPAPSKHSIDGNAALIEAIVPSSKRANTSSSKAGHLVAN